MRDIIDERNEKERISKSIVKFWNVNYIPAPASGGDKAEEEVLMQAEDDAAGSQETEVNGGGQGAAAELSAGTDICDRVEQERIDRILQEKEEAFKSLIDEHAEDEEQ